MTLIHNFRLYGVPAYPLSTKTSERVHVVVLEGGDTGVDTKRRLQEAR